MHAAHAFVPDFCILISTPATRSAYTVPCHQVCKKRKGAGCTYPPEQARTWIWRGRLSAWLGKINGFLEAEVGRNGRVSLVGRMLRMFASKLLGNLDLRPVARLVSGTCWTRGSASATPSCPGTGYLEVETTQRIWGVCGVCTPAWGLRDNAGKRCVSTTGWDEEEGRQPPACSGLRRRTKRSIWISRLLNRSCDSWDHPGEQSPGKHISGRYVNVVECGVVRQRDRQDAVELFPCFRPLWPSKKLGILRHWKPQAAPPYIHIRQLHHHCRLDVGLKIAAGRREGDICPVPQPARTDLSSHQWLALKEVAVVRGMWVGGSGCPPGGGRGWTDLGRPCR